MDKPDFSLYVEGFGVDADLTLFDSSIPVSTLFTRFLNHVGLHYQLPPKYADVESTDVGTQLMHDVRGSIPLATVRTLLPTTSDAEVEELAALLELWDEDAFEGTAPMPGAAEFLASIDSQRLVVITAAAEIVARRRMQAAGLPTPQFFSDGASIPPEFAKPHPEHSLIGARLIGVAPALCLGAGDSPKDVLSAKSAGFAAFVGVAGDEDHAKVLIHAGADVVVPNLGSQYVRVEPYENGFQVDCFGAFGAKSPSGTSG